MIFWNQEPRRKANVWWAITAAWRISTRSGCWEIWSELDCKKCIKRGSEIKWHPACKSVNDETLLYKSIKVKMSTYPDEIFRLLAGTQGSPLHCTSTLKFTRELKYSQKTTKLWWERSKKKEQRRLCTKYLFVDKRRVRLCFGFIAVHRALQG